MKSTLQSKIALAMWFITAVSTLMAVILTGSLLIRNHRESIKHQLEASATALMTLGISDFEELKDFEQLNQFIRNALQMDQVETIIRIYDRSQKLIFTTVGLDYDRLPESISGPIDKPIFLTIAGKSRTYESLVMPYSGGGKKKSFYLQVVMPLPKYSQMLERLWWQSLVLFGLLIGISLFISRWLSMKLLRPVEVIAHHLETMDPTVIETWRPLQLDEKGQYLRAIIDGVNALGERTQAAIAKLRKMSRYVAHEMRTPLTILQGEAETVLLKKEVTEKDYREVLTSSLEEVQRMSETVTTVLQVGDQSLTDIFFQLTPCDLGKWIVECSPHWERTLGHPMCIALPPDGNVVVRIDPKLLYRLMDNLIRNVRDHAPQGSSCTLSLRHSSGVRLLLEDQGPGMDQALVDSLNNQRSASQAAGIGLHLCYRIAELCGLRMVVSNRSGGGLCVEIRF